MGGDFQWIWANPLIKRRAGHFRGFGVNNHLNATQVCGVNVAELLIVIMWGRHGRGGVLK